MSGDSVLILLLVVMFAGIALEIRRFNKEANAKEWNKCMCDEFEDDMGEDVSETEMYDQGHWCKGAQEWLDIPKQFCPECD